MTGLFTEENAWLSQDRKYRYCLWRIWNVTKRGVCFCGLNPSTADERKNDPTIRRQIAYAKDWGFGSLYAVNLFAYRATDPELLRVTEDPVGPDNDLWIKNISRKCALTVAIWGVHGSYLGRDEQVKKLIKDCYYLRLTKNGHPSHLLYLPKNLKPIRWESNDGATGTTT
jgi:hypothetical protein